MYGYWIANQLLILSFQCFFCPTAQSFQDLIKQMQENINKKGQNAMFEIYEKPIEESLNLDAASAATNDFNTSDDEFELL